MRHPLPDSAKKPVVFAQLAVFVPTFERKQPSMGNIYSGIANAIHRDHQGSKDRGGGGCEMFCAGLSVGFLTDDTLNIDGIAIPSVNSTIFKGVHL